VNPAFGQQPPHSVSVLPPSSAGGPKPKLERPVKAFEKGSTWFIVAGVFALGALFVVGVLSTGLLSRIDDLRLGPNLRGYTYGGLTMGVLAVVWVLLAGWYSIRKRFNVTGGSMMTWLWAHVWLGLLAFFAAILHAGSGIISLSLSSGKILFFVFALIVLTGVLWRLAYATIPPQAAKTVLNYSQAGALDRAEQLALEIAKVTAGKSEALAQIKEILLAREMAPQELMALGARVPPDEHALIDELVQLAASRRRALARPPLQQRFTARLQRWRKWHVPITLAFFVLLAAHVFGALDVHRKLVPIGVATDGPLAAFRPSSDCRDCHKAAYDQWADSMHAHALTSPVTIIQNNLDMKHGLGRLPTPEPRRMCINCHGPAVAAMTAGETLPLGAERAKEGVECISCHQLEKAVVPGGGGLATVYAPNLARGDLFFGRLDGPIGNAYHRSQRNGLFDTPEQLCATCHMVNLDKNKDGRIVKGTDLVLQTTLDEYREYQSKGGKQTCVDCHMPVVAGVTDAANDAVPFLTEDYPPPPRKVHDHSFVGVDYPLDEVARRDPQKPKREALLRSAAQLSVVSDAVVGNELVLRLAIVNLTGHNLPTGFAFARQMWIELVVTEDGAPLFSSGLLRHPGDDLCDGGTFGDITNPLRGAVVGCTEVDRELVNIQLKLVDQIATQRDAFGREAHDEGGDPILIQAPGAQGETYLQEPTAGGVARKRPVDGAGLAPLRPLERREYGYTIALPPHRASQGKFTARLLFRNLPPYWLRGMAREQPKNEKPQIEPLIANVQTLEMAKVAGSFASAPNGHAPPPPEPSHHPPPPKPEKPEKPEPPRPKHR
jgi:hypothetical protein